ncbi:MAG: VanW family protein [Candidatus Peribacteraceae bacterium]|nr:VanW family protein [Candidatus Peribacteraceae bacterium]
MFTHKYKRYVISALSAVLLSGGALFLRSPEERSLTLHPFLPPSPLHAAAPGGSGSVIMHIAAEDRRADASSQRVALRLQARIRQRFGQTLSVPTLAKAIAERREILGRSVTVRYAADDGADFGTWDAALTAYAHWVHADIKDGSLRFAVDEEQVRLHLERFMPEGIVAQKDTLLRGSEMRHGVLYAVADTVAEPGYAFDASSAAHRLSEALASGLEVVDLPVSSVPGAVINESGEDLGPLELLATGKSDYRGSGGGRIANVRLGLQGYLNNVLIPPGETFSFNAAVNDMRGGQWQDALVIMNGTDLVPFPGGGICQVATTVYRAALLAGLPITERANHSLYVTYYEKYGVGIDATIFPKRQDLTFHNDTDRYLLLQAYTRGFEAFVHVYGVRDGRTVEMAGPYFQTNGTEEMNGLLGRPLRTNEIAWIRTVHSPVGSASVEPVLSRYQSVPRKLKLEYAPQEGEGYVSMH